MADQIERLIKGFEMVPHPAGNMYKECWRANRKVTFVDPTCHGGPRDAASTIYSLVARSQILPWHLVRSDEVYYWHSGGTLKVHMIDESGHYASHLLGDFIKDPSCVYSVVLPHDVWFASELVNDSEYVFFSALVAPGWEVQDWIAGKLADLEERFPQHSDILKRLCRA